jgi:hypothetical protein
MTEETEMTEVILEYCEGCERRFPQQHFYFDANGIPWCEECWERMPAELKEGGE